MIAKLLAAVSSPGNTDSCVNEDGFWFGKSGAVVLDGVTGFAGDSYTTGPSDASWLVNSIVSSLESRKDASESLEGKLEYCLCAAIQRLQQESASHIDPHRGPMAALGAASVHGDRLRYWLMGDVELLVQFPSGQTVRRQDTRSHAKEMRVLDEWRKLSALRLPYADRREAVRPMIRESRRTINTDGGYWLVGIANTGLSRAVVGELPLVAGTRVLVASDGMLRCTSMLGIDDAEYFADGEQGVHSLLARLRRCEDEDNECLRWARVKCHDDATAMLLEVSK